MITFLVCLALLVAGIAGTIAMTGWSAAAYTLSGQAFATASYYELSVLPLFILMGNLASASGLSRDLYEVAHRWIGHLRGGLAGATVHFVTAELDHGPIVAQGVVAVADDDTADSLAAKVLRVEHQIYPQAVRWFVEGRLTLAGQRVQVDGGSADGALVCPR